MRGSTKLEDPVTQALMACVPGLVLSLIASLFTSMLQLTIPLYMMQVFDRVLSSQSRSTLAWLTVIGIGALLVWALLEFGRSRVHRTLSHWIARRLSVEAINAIVQSGLRGSGNAGQALRDLNDLRMFLGGGAVTSAFEFVWSPLFLIVLFLLHPVLGTVALGGAVVLLVLGLLNEAVTHRPLSRASNASADSFGQIGSALRNADVIEAMGLMNALTRRWMLSNDRALEMLDSGNARVQAIGAISRFVRLSVQIAIIAAGTVLVIEKSISPGAIFAATLILGRALGPFEALIDGWRQWVFAWTSYVRVRGLFASTRMPRSATPLPRPDGPLVVERLVYTPPGAARPALRGISVTIPPGEAIGVVGPSAAGKSTLARLLVGIARPSSGSVRWAGHEVYTWERASFGSYVGYLPQDVGLFDATVRDNIARLGPHTPSDVIEAAKRADVHDLIGRLPHGYDTDISDSSQMLTGGQRQRIGLARAIFGNPAMLVLDEPDANLDQQGEAALLDAIDMCKAAGAIVIVISHRRAVLEAMDRLLLLREGLIEEIGPRADLLPKFTNAAARVGQTQGRAGTQKLTRG